MKTILTASLIHLFISSYSLANGGLSKERQEAKLKENSRSDEIYLDELKTRDSAIQRSERSKEKMKENPRNEALVESFGHVGEKKIIKGVRK